MNNNEQFDTIVNVVSLVLGIMNLKENLTQRDKQELMESLNTQTKILLNEIHQHLETQDKKLDKILELLYNKNEDMIK